MQKNRKINFIIIGALILVISILLLILDTINFPTRFGFDIKSLKIIVKFWLQEVTKTIDKNEKAKKVILKEICIPLYLLNSLWKAFFAKR